MRHKLNGLVGAVLVWLPARVAAGIILRSLPLGSGFMLHLKKNEKSCLLSRWLLIIR